MTAKDPSNYQDREVQKNEQVPIDIKMSDDEFVSPTIVSVNNTVDENAVKQRATKNFFLGKQLSENTVRMDKIKKIK